MREIKASIVHTGEKPMIASMRRETTKAILTNQEITFDSSALSRVTNVTNVTRPKNTPTSFHAPIRLEVAPFKKPKDRKSTPKMNRLM